MNAYAPYWQSDLSLGEGVFFNEARSISRVRRGIRILLHVGTERYYGRQEIVPITQEGDLTSVHAQPYTFLPSGLSRRLPFLGTLLRRVSRANWEWLDYQTLGDCHAWYYHQDRLLMLWDCLLDEAAKDPRTDQNLCAVWNGFERFLLVSFPDTAWIATPPWEPVYETKDWQAFLTRMGYQPFNQQAFLKKVAHT